LEPNICLDDRLNETGESNVMDLTFGPDDAPDDDTAAQLATTCKLAALGEPPIEESRKNPFNSEKHLEDDSARDSTCSRRGSNAGQTPGWRPTSAWLKEYKQALPLETIYRMICALEPQLDQLRLGRGRPIDEPEIIKFLQNGTLVGLLPVPHPIQIRKYRPNDGSTMWLRACTWGIIYVRSTVWTGTDIRLIKIL
jgi:hypothetical protein